MFHAQPTDFGYVMEDRPYDQSSVVLTIDGARATFRNHHALDGERRVLYEQQLPFAELEIALQRLEPTTANHATVGYLSNTLVANIYHWLFLVLPMLRFYEAAGLDISHYYVGEALRPWQVDSLDFVGISEDQIVVDACIADTAHVATLTRHTGGVPREQIRWARSTFVKNEPGPGNRRLFLGRGDSTTRHMLDEEVLADALQREFGFEYVTSEGKTFQEQIELFGEAESVVAPYGAAMTNLLFSPVGTKVLELTAFDNDFSIAHCYQEMSAELGHQHGIIRGEPTPRRKRGVNSNIAVDPDLVLREVDKMLNAKPEASPPTIDLREAARAPQQPALGHPQDH